MMGSSFTFILVLFLTIFSSFTTSQFQTIKSARLLDLIIRDFTFKKLNNNNIKTGILHSVNLPANLSGIDANIARYRCGSLRRYGARIKEFHLSTGVTVHPCIERVAFIRQRLSLNWSDVYYDNFNLDGYRLITPILGLFAYNSGDDSNGSNPFELTISSGENPIKIDFTNVTMLDSDSLSSSEIVHKQVKQRKRRQPYCASFEGSGGGGGGKVTLANMVAPYVCEATKQGHFGLVIEGQAPSVELSSRRKESKWKVAVGCAIGAALGAFLLGLLFIAMFAQAKKRSKMEEMVRRAYQEEALQVSMVGHVRAPTAPATRTQPIIEHHYRPPPL